ncbi:MAG: septal ring lytic transglycosylase RlpA family protein [Ectothiorhodospiraceae bacterium]|jgi:rare lipoprotein A
MRGRVLRGLAGAAATALAVGCSPLPTDGPGRPISDPGAIPDARPRQEPPSKYGNPESYVVNGRRYEVMDGATNFHQRGIASWYGKKFHGKRTSSGEPYDMYKMTAAHKRLPLPTYVEVTNLRNGRQVVVKVNDRGPFARNRIIDLSYAAAAKLDMLGHGTAPVEIRTVGQGTSVAGTTAQTAPAKEPDSSEAVDYYVQVGAFSNRDNAFRMLGRMEAAELPAPVRVETGQSGGQRIYRVRVGPLDSAEAVDRLTADLEAHGVSESQVVVADQGAVAASDADAQ